ncbi:polysaccharide deacetylase family protein [Nitrososphaera sp.]|uniref:polysaccharide deacetylase family protein n=1 Tax=Nitrososphaera sp. TaxID=1971748 RepID=UPI0031772789
MPGMRMALLGAIATTIVIGIGVLIAIGPSLIQTLERTKPTPVMLSFSMVNGWNAPQWCNDLASVLQKHDVKATVFVTGEVAEQHPECVTAFASQGTDVGSQTYRYVNLNAVADYQYALEEVRMGKEAVDRAGNIDSHVFRAPFGETNQDIYSLLSSSDITADFSYTTQYNKYEGDQFVKHDLVSCDCRDEPERIEQLLKLDLPIIINIDNNTAVGEIESLIVSLKEKEMSLVSASELTETDLTVEGASA